MKALKNMLILCVASCITVSCQKKVDMTLVQKTVLENADIRQIEVSDAWEVTVVADSNTFVELEYSAYLEERIKAKMEGTQLELGFIESTYPVISSVFRATVHLSKLEKLEAEEASTIQCNGAFEGTQLEMDLSGASICSGLTFAGSQCEIEVEETSKLIDFRFEGLSCKAALHKSSQFNGQIQASDLLDIELTDASRFVNKGGETANANIVLREASMLNTVETQVAEMHVALSNFSEATVWVTDLLEGQLTHASTIYYKGNPLKQVDCDESSTIQALAKNRRFVHMD